MLTKEEAILKVEPKQLDQLLHPNFDNESLKKLLPKYFSMKKGLFHYWHMAKTNYREYLKTEQVRIKKYFYIPLN